nr:hypothetical protein [Tanacetum cinerariifolium]
MRVAEALEAYDAAKNPETEPEMENEQQDHNVKANVNNRNSNGNENRNPNVKNGEVPRVVPVMYKDGPEEEDLVEKYIGGLLNNIQRKVIAADPTRLEDAIRIANSLMGQKLNGYAIKNDENKRRRGYGGGFLYYNKYRMHHEGSCTVKNQTGNTCYECGRQGHYRNECPKLRNQNHVNKTVNNEAKARANAIGGGGANPDCNVFTDISYAVELADGRTSETNAVLRGCTLGLLVAATTQRASVGNQTGNTCYECGRQGHYRNECPKLRNQNHVNKTGNNKAKARANAIGGGGANPDCNVFTDISYAVELADGRISETNATNSTDDEASIMINP